MPNENESTAIVYGPAKSWIIPFDLFKTISNKTIPLFKSHKAIPVCPMKGIIQVIKGKAVQTTQYGKRSFSGDIGSSLNSRL